MVARPARTGGGLGGMARFKPCQSTPRPVPRPLSHCPAPGWCLCQRTKLQNSVSDPNSEKRNPFPSPPCRAEVQRRRIHYSQQWIYCQLLKVTMFTFVLKKHCRLQRVATPMPGFGCRTASNKAVRRAGSTDSFWDSDKQTRVGGCVGMYSCFFGRFQIVSSAARQGRKINKNGPETYVSGP